MAIYYLGVTVEGFTGGAVISIDVALIPNSLFTISSPRGVNT